MIRRPLQVAGLVVSALAVTVVAAHGWSAGSSPVETPTSGDRPRVALLSAPSVGYEGWSTAPVKAVLIAPGKGQTWYRLGAGPGAWVRYDGPIDVPPGKQTLSALYVAPDGIAGPVVEQVVRSDYRLRLTRSADSLVSSVAGSVQSTGTTPVTNGVVSVSASIKPSTPGATMHRIGGADRYATSAQLSSSAFNRASTVIIATGEKFPDALASSGLSGCLGAPVLLVHRKSIPTPVYNEIKRLRARNAIIVGATPAVDDAVANKLKKMGLKIERLGGRTRYETAVVISQRVQKLTRRTDLVAIARGDQFPPALIISPLAYSRRLPTILTPPNELKSTVAARLRQAHYRNGVIVGYVSGSTAASISRYIPAVEQWTGVDDYDASVVAAAHEVLKGGVTWAYVGIARGDAFPDALCGGVVAGRRGGVIMLTPPTSLYPGVGDALTVHAGEISLCEVYGSPAAISDDVYNRISAALH